MGVRETDRKMEGFVCEDAGSGQSVRARRWLPLNLQPALIHALLVAFNEVLEKSLGGLLWLCFPVIRAYP